MQRQHQILRVRGQDSSAQTPFRVLRKIDSCPRNLTINLILTLHSLLSLSSLILADNANELLETALRRAMGRYSVFAGRLFPLSKWTAIISVLKSHEMHVR